MVVNESALLRAMREDYKGQGYTVARRAENEADPESESILLLSANDWMVEIGWKNVSAKIFGLVAEHMKGLPEVGDYCKSVNHIFYCIYYITFFSCSKVIKNFVI